MAGGPKRGGAGRKKKALGRSYPWKAPPPNFARTFVRKDVEFRRTFRSVHASPSALPPPPLSSFTVTRPLRLISTGGGTYHASCPTLLESSESEPLKLGADASLHVIGSGVFLRKHGGLPKSQAPSPFRSIPSVSTVPIRRGDSLKLKGPTASALVIHPAPMSPSQFPGPPGARAPCACLQILGVLARGSRRVEPGLWAKGKWDMQAPYGETNKLAGAQVARCVACGTRLAVCSKCGFTTMFGESEDIARFVAHRQWCTGGVIPGAISSKREQCKGARKRIMCDDNDAEKDGDGHGTARPPPGEPSSPCRSDGGASVDTVVYDDESPLDEGDREAVNLLTMAAVATMATEPVEPVTGTPEGGPPRFEPSRISPPA